MQIKFIVILFLLAVSISSAQEIESIQADRPDQTETPFTVPANHLQMENGFSFEKSSSEEKTYTLPSTLIKYGLNDHFEIGVIVEFASVQTDKLMTGFNPLVLRFKEKISEEKGLLPKTSVIGYLSLPFFGHENFRTTYYAPAFRFTMQHTLSQRISLAYNLGAEWDGETAEPVFIYTLTTGLSVSSKVGVYAEVYGFSPQFSRTDHRFDCGLNYLLKNNIMFDVSGGMGLINSDLDYYFALGFSFRLKN